MTKIQDKDLATLCVDLIIPMVVGDMLAGTEELDDVAEYTIHEMIGEMAPDTALLCVALCAQRIAGRFGNIPTCHALDIESNRIIEEYAPLWLAYKNKNTDLSDKEIRDLLVYIPEDLEALGDLLDTIQASLARNDNIASYLCEILAVQAHAHSEAAQTRLEELNMPVASRDGAHALPGTDNVIVFPGRCAG